MKTVVNVSFIDVKSCFGHEIKNKYLVNEPPSSGLAVLFPGQNYSCDRPLLYYAASVALQGGFDVLRLEYGYWAAGVKFTGEIYPRIIEETFEDVQKCLQKPYKDVFFISKSLGTIFAGEISRRLGPENVNNLFLTPVPMTLHFLADAKCRIIAGSADEQFPKELLENPQNFPLAELVTIENANHSLEIAGDYKKSIEALACVCGVY